MALDTASAIVRAEARQSFTRRHTTVALYPRAGWATLPQRPVITVDAVRAGSVLDPVSGWTLVRDRIRLPRSVGGPVVVTYTHGYATVPPDVRAVVLTLAGRVLNNPADLRQETVGGVSVTYASETIGASLAPADRDLLARYRRVAAVVRLK
ncbi:hypothetical protein [Streptomyces huiliensis]|uniref:hypothetical protein n=1 Tax=Streptomyces huiliensis TaxID=2876027 RepID=UPI001CBC0306|nr:hypothetical protein [Streptomyces huiliensis]MBZ4319533.1 hypothetical protein [Streptomyces huiliensis]